MSDRVEFTGIELRRAIIMLNRVLESAVRLMKEQGVSNSGGFFCLSGEVMAPLVIIQPWGDMQREQRVEYSELTREKLKRLAGRLSHSTSYQSRNPDATVIDSRGYRRLWGKWGGAVRAGDKIASFSGFPELWDEAAMFVLSIRMGWLDETATLRRISRKRNPNLRPLLEATRSIA